jgi:hypothetical protein
MYIVVTKTNRISCSDIVEAEHNYELLDKLGKEAQIFFNHQLIKSNQV